MTYTIRHTDGRTEVFARRSDVNAALTVSDDQWRLVEAGKPVTLASFMGQVTLSRTTDARPQPMTKADMKKAIRILADIISSDLLEDRFEYGITDLCHCYKLSTAQAAYLRKLILASM